MENKKNGIIAEQHRLDYVAIAVLGALFFLPFLGSVHLFDWDEINFAEAAREMLATGNYMRVQIDYQPFWEKPPLFIWMQALSMKAFGVNEFAARLPNAVAGAFSLLAFYHIGKKQYGRTTGITIALLYLGSWLPHLYFKSGIIDPWFNLFIFLSLYHIYKIQEEQSKSYYATAGGILLGLAVMTKGPVALLIVLLTTIIYFIVRKSFKGYNIGDVLLYAVAAFLTVSIWFGIDVLQNGWWFFSEFITYQIRLFRTEDAGHGGPFFYHWVVLLVGCFPASAFLLQYLKNPIENAASSAFNKLLWIMLWVVLLLFSIVKTKIVHYSSLCYIPLVLLAAQPVARYVNGTLSMSRWVKVALLFLGLVWAMALALLPIVGLYKQVLIPYIKDPFAVANLQAVVPWHRAEALFGIGYLVALLMIMMMIRRQRYKQALAFLLPVQVAIIFITMTHFTPKIEAYSQRAAIQYFQQFQNQDVYVKPLGYKSYAHLFYSKKKPNPHPKAHEQEWLLNGKVDKPVYFICKIQNAEEYRKLPHLVEIGSKNGFVFFKRAL